MSKGVIYILTNPAFDEYVKIGYASNLENRLKTLNNSSALPYAFRVYAVYEVDSKLTDKELHKLIDTLNPDLRAIEHFDGKTRTKEFFAMSPEDAYTILECIAKISGTQKSLKRMKPEGHEVLDEKTAKEIKEEARKGPFRFSDCDIPAGAEIEYIDDPAIRPTVVDDRHIEYNGETTSLSKLAQTLRNSPYPVQGTLWFRYNGEILNDRRNRLEQGKD